MKELCFAFRSAASVFHRMIGEVFRIAKKLPLINYNINRITPSLQDSI